MKDTDTIRSSVHESKWFHLRMWRKGIIAEKLKRRKHFQKNMTNKTNNL